MIEFPAVTVCNVNPLVKNKTLLEDHKFWYPFIELERENAVGELQSLHCSIFQFSKKKLNLVKLEQNLFRKNKVEPGCQKNFKLGCWKC